MINMILCSDIRGGIGFNNSLLYNIKDDMKFFRETTKGHKIVMGYNTWLSLPKKPLPNRENYVIYDGEEEIEGAIVLRSIDEIIRLGKNDTLFVIGGAMLYNTLIELDLVDVVYLTLVYDISYSADTFVKISEINKKLPLRKLIKELEYIDDRGHIPVHIYRYNKDKIYI